MVHPVHASRERALRKRQGYQPAPRPQQPPLERPSWTFQDAYDFLLSAEANRREGQRFAAQHGLVNLLESNTLEPSNRARAVELLEEESRNRRLGRAVFQRIVGNDTLRIEVFGR